MSVHASGRERDARHSKTAPGALHGKIVAVFLWVLLYVLTGALVCVLGRVLFGYLLCGEPLSWGAWRWPHVVDWALVSWIMFAWTRWYAARRGSPGQRKGAG